MRDRIKIWMWKGCIVVLGVLLVWQVGNLFENLGRKEDASVQHFVASDTSEQGDESLVAQPVQTTPIPFQLTNFDKIRVVLTNKETGGIYHEDAEGFKENSEYRGVLEFLETDEGYVIINELPIEEYLYSVVPSEMPASYPMEALKAQAICARTYAYLHILSPGYPQWNAHVDDTTAFQVYHSVEEQERTTQAVNETQGQVLLAPGGKSLAETYYYSTSCGVGSDAHVWRTKYSDNYPYIKSKQINKDAVLTTIQGEGAVTEQASGEVNEAVSEMEQVADEAVPAMVQAEDILEDMSGAIPEVIFAEFIRNINVDDFEVEEPWYRWSYEVNAVDLERMLETLQKRYAANKELILTLKGSEYVSKPIEELDALVDLMIERREAGGVADELLIITEKNVYKVITELNIRYVLNDGVTKVVRQDGSKVTMPTLLPSAFMILENQYDNGEVSGYDIIGGGFGHGAGMSQNAAKSMAEDGMSAEEILTFFFEDCTLEER